MVSKSMQKFGKQLGYPPCCIKYFVDSLNSIGAEEWEEYTKTTPLLGTGLITCPRCSKNVAAVLTYINKNRDPELPRFPEARGLPIV